MKTFLFLSALLIFLLGTEYSFGLWRRTCVSTVCPHGGKMNPITCTCEYGPHDSVEPTAIGKRQEALTPEGNLPSSNEFEQFLQHEKLIAMP